jgi:hypothetical protein
VVNAVCVEERAAPLDAVNLIPFAEKKFSQIGPILPGYTGDQCNFCHVTPCQSVLQMYPNLSIILAGDSVAISVEFGGRCSALNPTSIGTFLGQFPVTA